MRKPSGSACGLWVPSCGRRPPREYYQDDADTLAFFAGDLSTALSTNATLILTRNCVGCRRSARPGPPAALTVRSESTLKTSAAQPAALAKVPFQHHVSRVWSCRGPQEKA